jgi:hypothetical protein
LASAGRLAGIPRRGDEAFCGNEKLDLLTPKDRLELHAGAEEVSADDVRAWKLLDYGATFSTVWPLKASSGSRLFKRFASTKTLTRFSGGQILRTYFARCQRSSSISLAYSRRKSSIV